jgi:hypothetical protein
MEALKKFFGDHMGHPLVFDENCESELADWDEIEAKPEPTSLPSSPSPTPSPTQA